MATVSGYMKCSQVVVGHIIHRYVVLNQELNAVEMVPLGRHVQRRQAILEVESGGGRSRVRNPPLEKKDKTNIWFLSSCSAGWVFIGRGSSKTFQRAVILILRKQHIHGNFKVISGKEKEIVTVVEVLNLEVRPFHQIRPRQE